MIGARILQLAGAFLSGAALMELVVHSWADIIGWVGLAVGLIFALGFGLIERHAHKD